MEAFQALAEVHRLDCRRASIETELRSFPDLRARAGRLHEEAKASVEAAHARLLEAELEQRRLEAELRDQEELCKRLSAQTVQVKSNEAYHALLHEIDAGQAACSDLETRILEALEAIDRGRAAVAEAEARAAERASRAAEQEKELAEREAVLSQELEELGNARAERAARVEPGLLARYQRVADRRLPALASLSDGTCSECHRVVPRQRAMEIRRGELCFSCESCQRLLLPEQVLQPPA
jgi:predicted  nucleic acid-binding Zn-ribbon protein